MQKYYEVVSIDAYIHVFELVYRDIHITDTRNEE